MGKMKNVAIEQMVEDDNRIKAFESRLIKVGLSGHAARHIVGQALFNLEQGKKSLQSIIRDLLEIEYWTAENDTDFRTPIVQPEGAMFICCIPR